ncbi:MAG TPA: hypothetical protein VLH39_00055 [Magnetospirillaceae bacterium]|nr:hypothetical protein [Magnetospirillaceae bacterium]
MRRSFITLVGVGGELARYFGLIAISRAFLGGDGKGTLLLLQFAASPHLLFAGGFFFLWLDPLRYGAFRPLLAAGKALSLFGLGSLFAWFLTNRGSELLPGGDPVVLLGAMAAILVWDMAAGAALLRSLASHPMDAPGHGTVVPDPEPEPVETE